jgi:hypothetical protein
VRTVELGIPALEAAGWISVRRRLPAILRLSNQTKDALVSNNAQIAPAAKAEPGIVRPTGFFGDPVALKTAKPILGMRSNATDRELATEYLDRASALELARIEALRDEHGVVPVEILVITGDARLDFGLRDHFEALAAKYRHRSKLRTMLGFDDH